MPIYEHRKETHLDNPQVSSWMNILPPLKDTAVLKIGTQKTENLKSLIKCDCRILVCIGKKEGQINKKSIEFYKSLSSIEKIKFDYCIIDEFEYFYKMNPHSDIEQKISLCFELLKETGSLLIGLPNGVNYLGAKLFIRRILFKKGFNCIQSFICEPSFDDPIFIFPASNFSKYTKQIFIEDLFQSSKLKSVIKDTIKFLIIKLSIKINPLTGIFYYATKKKGVLNCNFFDKFIKNSAYESETIKKSLYTIWIAKPYVGKQIGLVHNIINKKRELIAICKQSNQIDHRASDIRKEYDILKLLSEHTNFLDSLKVKIPKPIYFGVEGERVFSLESAVKGAPVTKTGMPVTGKKGHRAHNFSDYIDILNELVSIHIKLQNYFSDNLDKQLSVLEPKYFENSLNLSYAFFQDERRVDSYRKNIQHGDYTLVNFLYDKSNKHWGIIDWEWFYRGFPPLFDLFYLFTSIGYRKSIDQKVKMFDRHFLTFVDTFFSKNWFSDFLRVKIKEHCDYFEVDLSETYNYFLDYLLVVYNKYRLDYNLPQFEDLYKRMISYSIQNKNKFLFP